MVKTTALASSIGAVLVAGTVGGRFGPQRPDRAVWYARLRKPSYTPPGPVIGLAWGVLDSLLCVTGYRLLSRPSGPARNIAVGAWGMTLAGLAGYPALFFGARSLGGSLTASAGMLAAAATASAAASQVDRTAAAANLPLVGWTAFATLLSEEVWRRN